MSQPRSNIFSILLVLALVTGLLGWKEASAQALIDLNAVSAAGAEALVGPNVAEAAPETEEEKLEFVTVRYKERGRLLALVPITFTVTARAYADGRVELIYPWYSKLTIDNERELRDQIRIAADHTIRARAVGSVRSAEEPEQKFFTPAEAAAVTEAIQAVLEARADAEGTVD